MNNNIATFKTALKAEHIKKKGTGFYYNSIVFGLISPLLYFIVSIIQSNENLQPKMPFNHLLNFTNESLIPFANFFFPLMIIIMVSRITQLDHKNGGWQLMETQPVSKFSIYFSKFTIVLFSQLLAVITFIIASVFLGWLLIFIIPIAKEATIELPFWELISIMSRLFVASLFIAALQYVISVLIPSFIWTIIIGFFGLLLTVFLRPFQLLPVWYPYEILAKISDNNQGSDLGYWFTFTETIGVLCTVVILYIGYNWYRFKKIKLAFFKPKQAISLALILIVSGGIFFWLMRPNQMENHSITVLSGKFESDENFHNIYVLDVLVEDTLAVIPIKNNQFKSPIEAKLTPDLYILDIDGKYKGQLFFGNNDSIYLNLKIYNHQQVATIYGTRLAENRLNEKDKATWTSINYYLDQNINLEKPDFISDEIHSEWKEKMNETSTFRTVDNYIPKEDYRNRAKKLITVTYLNLWNNYLEKRHALYPKLQTPENNNIKEIRQNLSLDDESLLSDESYFNYVKNQLIASDKADTDENTKALSAISKLKNTSFKDKMLFWQMKKSLEEASNTAERNKLIANYNPNFQQVNYQKRITSLNKMIESLAKGRKAPLFEATSVDEKQFSLADLKGKYVLIDVWATWCGPCKFQSPYFEKFALKYKTENILFIALSTDINKMKWYIEAKNKSQAMPQLHLNNPQQFGIDYNLENIPRFILIDPNGNFVNARMPFPSEPSFEIILRKALGLPDEL